MNASFQVIPRTLQPLMSSDSLMKATVLMLASLLALTGQFSAATTVGAGELSAALSSQEAYVGAPIRLSIVVENAGDWKMPKIPKLEGVTIKPNGLPSSSSQTSFINGRVNHVESVELGYSVVADVPGEFTIEPIMVTVDGEDLQTPPLRFVANRSETGDLMFVEIESSRDRVYVGEPLETTLKIWLRPFRDSTLDLTLREIDMWGCLSDATRWGGFADAIDQMRDQNKMPAATEVLRKDQEGESRAYYLYEIEATVYPKRPGRIDGGDVRVVVDYPVRLTRSRRPVDSFFDGGFFGGDSLFRPQLRIGQTRPIVAEASVDATEVLPIPTDQRPESYKGAVGRYEITARTDKTDVHAGDPITLQIGIRGEGPLEFVQAPPMQGLETGFRVDQQPLAGFIRDGVKYFTTTIRPRDATVKEIPAIEMSFFDPASGTFETARTEPIEIAVGEAEMLALDSVSDRDDGSRAKGILESLPDESNRNNRVPFYDRHDFGPDMLVDEPVASALPWFAVFYLVPPFCFLIFAAVVNRSQVANFSSWWSAPNKRALQRLEATTQPDEIPVILTDYIFATFEANASDSSAPWLSCLGRIRANGLSAIAADLETLHRDCRSGTIAMGTLRDRAVDWIERADAARRSLPTRRLGLSPRSRSSLGTGTAIGLVLCVCTGNNLNANTLATDLHPRQIDSRQIDSGFLDSRQQSVLIEEAGQAYRQSSGGDVADAARLHQAAITKLSQVSGSSENGELYHALADAYRQSGQPGQALANYRRAQKYHPLNLRIQGKSLVTQFALGFPASEYYLPAVWTILGCAASMLGWSLLSLALFRRRRSLVVAAVVLLSISAGCFMGWVRTDDKNSKIAIVTTDNLNIRSGDGDAFETVTSLRDSEGRSFQAESVRGDWVRIQLDGSTSGWVPRDQVELLY